MAGDDEVRARSVLIEMQGRILKGPQVTLGVDSTASGEQIHSAFLQLTKQFHPARFGRMSPELQRLSNEVFLGIKSAHDMLLRSVGGLARPTASSSGTMPILQAEGSNRMATKPAQVTQPLPRGTVQLPAVPRTFTPSRASTPPGQSPAISRTFTPSRAMPIKTPTPAFGVRTVRQGTPPERPGTPPQTPPRAGTPPQPPPQQAAQPPAAFDERGELQRALDRITAKDWAGARGILHTLVVRTQSKQYRALVCYTRGREAQLAGKGEEAKMEFDRALQLDPDQHHAKSALAELLRRR